MLTSLPESPGRGRSAAGVLGDLCSSSQCPGGSQLRRGRGGHEEAHLGPWTLKFQIYLAGFRRVLCFLPFQAQMCAFPPRMRVSVYSGSTGRWRSPSPAAEPPPVCLISPPAIRPPSITRLASSDGRSAGFPCCVSTLTGLRMSRTSSEERGFIDQQLRGGPGRARLQPRRRWDGSAAEGGLASAPKTYGRRHGEAGLGVGGVGESQGKQVTGCGPESDV